MHLLDGMFLAVVLGLGAWQTFGRETGAWPVWLSLAAAIATLQLLVCGFTWQAVPGWGLMAAVLAERALHLRPSWWTRAGFLLLGAVALAPWAVLPEVALPPPDGPYAVRSDVLRWTDPTRAEAAPPALADRRSVIVQAWRPSGGGDAPSPPYLDGLGRLPAQVMGAPRFLLHRWDRIRTGTGRRQQPLPPAGGWPVILFSPGFGAPRAAYSGLARQLASRGYVVLAIDHPYEAPLTQLPDGRLAAGRPLPGRTESQLIGAMDRQAQVRADDLRFVIGQLSRPGVLPADLRGRLDLSRLAAGGHSFGGAAAVLAAEQDPRITAVIDVDGTLYAGGGGSVGVPVLVIESGRETPHGDRYQAGIARLVAHGARRIVLPHTNHYSFTDAEFALAPPAAWASHLLLGGARGAAATQRDTATAIDAFLRPARRGRIVPQ